MKNIILIGGAPTVGKSTIAKQLSEKLGIPWISTDTLRELIKSIGKKEDFPNIFSTKDYSAEDFLSKTIEEIVQAEIEEAKETWKAIISLINESYPWKYFIIEGIAILPSLVKQYTNNNKKIKTVFLVDEDADRIKEVVFTRGLWDDAKTYPDHLKDREIEWALAFSHMLKEESEKYGFPSVEVTKDDSDLERVIEALL